MCNKYSTKMLVLVQLIAVVASMPPNRTTSKAVDSATGDTNKLLNLKGVNEALVQANKSSGKTANGADASKSSAPSPSEYGDDDQDSYYDFDESNAGSNHKEPSVFGMSAVTDEDFQSFMENAEGDEDNDFLRSYRHSIYEGDDTTFEDLVQAAGAYNRPQILHEQISYGRMEPADGDYANSDDY